MTWFLYCFTENGTSNKHQSHAVSPDCHVMCLETLVLHALFLTVGSCLSEVHFKKMLVCGEEVKWVLLLVSGGMWIIDDS
ncbi:unnamed protein product [Sphagnum jensenii]|uniref:Uncharacterized protein n=1 Tax=Sphagnum jensenii TaxID=128206 RepID=A0ABP0X1S4_9BRYO